MASQKSKFAVGLFITCGIGVAVLALIWLGMSRYFETGKLYATFFNESVQGLEVDSFVKYRGVPVGRVIKIGVAPDSRLIQVILKLDTGQGFDEDIVAQLKVVGITGSVFVELDRVKKGQRDQSPHLSFPSEYPIIATRPSSVSELLQGLDDVLAKIEVLDMKGISDNVKLVLGSVNQVIQDADVKGLSENLNDSIQDIRRRINNKKWDKILASMDNAGKSLGHITGKMNTSMDRIDHTMKIVEGIVTEKEKTVKTAIDEFQMLMNYLKVGRV